MGSALLEPDELGECKYSTDLRCTAVMISLCYSFHYTNYISHDTSQWTHRTFFFLQCGAYMAHGLSVYLSGHPQYLLALFPAIDSVLHGRHNAAVDIFGFLSKPLLTA